MNFAAIMQGKLTYRAAYTLMAAGLYLISYEVADMLDAAVAVDMRHIIAEILRGDGFKTLMGGLGLYGLRRALVGTPEEEAEEPLTHEEREARLREILTEAETIIKQSKGYKS